MTGSGSQRTSAPRAASLHLFRMLALLHSKKSSWGLCERLKEVRGTRESDSRLPQFFSSSITTEYFKNFTFVCFPNVCIQKHFKYIYTHICYHSSISILFRHPMLMVQVTSELQAPIPSCIGPASCASIFSNQFRWNSSTVELCNFTDP